MTAPANTSLRWARAAVGVAFGLLVLKAIAAWLTDSRAVFSDAAESIVNVVASGVMLLAVRAASRPADLEHPFGHGKAEQLAAAFEGALLLVAATAIAWEAAPSLLDPQPLQNPGLGGVLVAATAIGNGVFGGLLIRTGRKQRSPALIADGRHLMTDAVSTIAVLVSMGLVVLTDLLWLDPAVACLLALWIAYTGVSMIAASARALIDTRVPSHAADIARVLQEAPVEGLLDPHDLRVIDATSNAVVLLHARAPWMWNVERCAQVVSETEARIRGVFEIPTQVHLQLEPCTAKCCPSCSVEACERRETPPGKAAPLDPARISAPHPP